MEDVKQPVEIGEQARKLEMDFKKSVEPYRSDLWRYCYYITGSPWDAEDLVQDTLLKAFANLTKIYQAVNTKAYLLRIASNSWIDMKRKAKIHLDGLYDKDLEFQENDFNVMEAIEGLVYLLPPRQAVTFVLIEAFQYKAGEVAEMIGTTEGSVYTILHRVRKKLGSFNWENNKKQITAKLDVDKGLINDFIDAFHRKDPDALAGLLAEHASTDIKHAGHEFGRSEIKKNSLSDWMEIVRYQDVDARFYILWGRPVVVETERTASGPSLSNIHYLETEEGSIVRWTYYCFSWDMMKLVANELNLHLEQKKYMYNIH
ncbi:RNA polymerase sigma factor [Pseudalkalibacillus caeni]|uniref:RNA polymerase sigma factor n=1 Tax=Exobacillus caeni TaxID=2574798 RepID=A0A5R9EYT2_9BACL|nr:RNA polymerase sigma factor [Pseudalkalibacillus caeni]TLS35356.1 sigma-70 family RNA polymerase sigma factor [Pseudalkalibacillus caeni]